jgi:hypothetical protein
VTINEVAAQWWADRFGINDRREALKAALLKLETNKQRASRKGRLRSKLDCGAEQRHDRRLKAVPSMQWLELSGVEITEIGRRRRWKQESMDSAGRGRRKA